jgi:uncharacterized glyoxalase superfamily protein PhnB
MKNWHKYLILSILFLNTFATKAQNNLPDTGISGVYEVMTGTKDAQFLLRYFREFGFRVVDSAYFSEKEALALYGVNSKLKSYRLQNGEIDSHGLLRILQWDKPLGNGVGYAQPETVGQRMSVMLTNDVIRLVDIYKLEREREQKWLPFEPIFDDPLGVNKGSTKPIDFFNRPIGVRETCVYGEIFNHVFFQRYGYTIEGYGTVGSHSPLQTSEFTHHDFMIKGDLNQVTKYYSEALGMKPEQAEAVIDGDWQKGPKRVFNMPDGYTHWYRGFVSPNNICGKLKFFVSRGVVPDRSENQRIGELGITLHSFYTPKLEMVYDLIIKQGIKPTPMMTNEFKEKCFVFVGTDGVAWQIIEKKESKHQPIKKLEFKKLQN